MSLIDDLNQLKTNSNLNYKGNYLITIIMNQLSDSEKQALNMALENKLITASSIADLLNKNGHAISADSIRRYRKRLANGSN